ncbi:helix-turn-helix transcriptional regulator, partial [Avibacterium volantium]|uniref:helix-turn-helix transcriptional regulator n=1 Tax=Avibacterium TaxID=292486 RepID=UPI0039FCF2BC
MTETITLSRYANAKEVCALLGISKTAIHKYSKSGTFPKPIKIGNCLRWNMESVRAWIAKQEQPTNRGINGNQYQMPVL